MGGRGLRPILFGNGQNCNKVHCFTMTARVAELQREQTKRPETDLHNLLSLVRRSH